MEDLNQPTIIAPNVPKGKHKKMTIVLITAGAVIIVIAAFLAGLYFLYPYLSLYFPNNFPALHLSTSSSARLAKADFKNAETVAMIKAAESGDVDGVNAAVRAGADPNEFGTDNVTPLFFLLGESNVNMTGFAAVIAAGANPNLPSVDGYAPINFAARAKDPKFLQAMLKGGGNPNLVDASAQPLIFASANSDAWQNIEILLDSGADINATNPMGYTLAMYVSLSQDYEHVFWLLGKGADANHQTNAGLTLAKLIESDTTQPGSPQYVWRQKVIDLLKSKGVAI